MALQSFKAMHPILLLLLLCIINFFGSNAEHSPELLGHIQGVNADGPYLGLIVPNSAQMHPLLQSSVFTPHENFSYIDLSGRRFHVGKIENETVIVVMTGLGMINAAITTQLLVSFFCIKGVVHLGIAGNANSKYHIGDVIIPRQWAHTGLWSWQRYGYGKNDKLPWESQGDYTRDIGYLSFAKYSINCTKGKVNNLLNNVWYQPNENFPKNGTPEVRQHAFWVNVSTSYYQLAEKMENITLKSCVNSTACLSTKPKIVRVERGCSADIYVDNAAYRDFLHSTFNVTAIDMESASVALVCVSEGKPFIVMRSVSNLAGSSNEEKETSIFHALVSQNVVTVVTKFISLLSSLNEAESEPAANIRPYGSI